MDREKGIAAYEAMIGAEQYRKQIVDGRLDPLHKYCASGKSPVVRVDVSRVERMTDDKKNTKLNRLTGRLWLNGALAHIWMFW